MICKAKGGSVYLFEKWAPLDERSNGAHLIGSSPNGKTVQYIRPTLVIKQNCIVNSVLKF